GFGIPIVEAMHAGCPIACSGVTGLPEIARDDALFFDPSDPGNVAAAIARIWHDDQLCRQLAERGRRRAGEFTAQRLVAQHLDAFKLARRRYHPLKHWYR